MTNEYNPDGKEIRFIDSHYKDLFRIPDGGCIQIHYPDETVVKPCTFIDEYHTQIGYNVFHICQFAEIMERNGASYMPEPEIMGDEAVFKHLLHDILIEHRPQLPALQSKGFQNIPADFDHGQFRGIDLTAINLVAVFVHQRVIVTVLTGLHRKDFILSNLPCGFIAHYSGRSRERICVSNIKNIHAPP
jgi:hypothetical protein